jgi:hypothetical protein
MTDLLNEIDRRMKYLDRYLPQGRRVPVTNEERAQKIMELQEQFLAGRATALERERYERCIELLAIGKARMIAQQCSKP